MKKHLSGVRATKSQLAQLKKKGLDITDSTSGPSEFRKLEIRVETLEKEFALVAAQMRKVYGEHWLEEFKKLHDCGNVDK